MIEQTKFDFRGMLRQGLISGVIALSLAVLGLVELFGERYIVSNLVTMGQILIFLAPVLFSYLMARKIGNHRNTAILNSVVIGVASSLPMIVLIFLESAIDLRRFFSNVSPSLVDLLTFGQGPALGSLLLLVLTVILSILTVLFYFLPDKYTTPVLTGLLYTFLVGMFSEILTERARTFFGNNFAKFIFSSKALRIIPALVIFVFAAGLSYWRESRNDQKRPSLLTFSENGKPKWINIAIVSAFLLGLPLLLGTYLSEVINNVGIYVVMGMGLNIVVGYAGLLDLGYVAFFAIGAYTMAVMTSQGDLGIAGWNFWEALPVCVLAAAMAGVLLGIPVLKMRGDYLAIVTLGFGEIIRILVLSDLLKPLIGGAQGVLKIPKPSIGPITLLQPEQLYYVVLGGVLLAVFVASRLRDSRLGRQWMAMREDEDVAEAMGINLVNTKLLAFGIGAAFSGLAGAIFASKLTSIFPHSFNVFISINVLCLLIVGGIGSLPGVAIGALVVFGMPELLREFQVYRYLLYGMLLVIMMLARPEGIIPSEVHKREMRASREEDFAGAEGD